MDKGELRAWSEESLRQCLTKVIEMKSKRRAPYYVLVHSKSGYRGVPAKNADKKTQTMDLSKKKVIHVTLTIMDVSPIVPLIGTALFRIDNKTGEVRMIYILPQDKPMVPGFEVGKKVGTSERIHLSAQHAPIIYD